MIPPHNNVSQQRPVYSQLAEGCQYNVKKKRTELGQLVQILEHLRSSNDTLITSIARFANMSHDSATRNCEKLVSAGLVLREISHNNRKYKVTSEGISFLNDLRNLGNILYRYKLSDLFYH